MVTSQTKGAKPPEFEATARLAETPRAKPSQEQERKVLRLGKRTYPVWTPAMLEARERYRREGRRWYLLHDKLRDPRNLMEAWKQVRANRGAPGLSGQTIQQYDRQHEDRLRWLGEKLRQRSFRARPIRRVQIPKSDGSGKLRPLGIPEVEDRIVQAALVRLIEPIFEAEFLDVSYGFRPERGAHDALSQVETAIAGSRPYVVDADIRDCFGSIPHEGLMQVVARRIADGALLDLIRQFVGADIVEEMRRWTPEAGTPQGAVLSPLLANVYLHEFDLAMERAGFKVVRYADDFVILCGTEEEAAKAKELAALVLKQMGLELHPEKTRIVDARQQSFQFLGYEFWPWGRVPRDSSRKKLRDNIRSRTPRKSGISLRRVISLRINPMLRGWYAYFRQSNASIFREVDGYVRRRLRSILRRFAKRRGAAKRIDNLRYPNSYFARQGLLSLSAQHREEVGAGRLIPFGARA
jgi:RNA-directed DNA polymerase